MTATPTSLSLWDAAPRFTRQLPGARLVVLSGDDAKREATVCGERIVIGSSPDCGLVLRDPTVSRHHLEVGWNDSELELVDLGSKNGSYLHGNRFKRVTVPIGVEIAVGKTRIKILPDEQSVDPAEFGSEQFGSLVGRSSAMRQLFSLIEQVAPSDASVLVQGETGTGKELVAEELHRRSSRQDKPFVVFDCGAVPRELIESLLFGHVKGAFTGATSDHVGVFEEADGGTVFLDEIGELSLELQPALLRVLDAGTIRPVGATRYRKVDVRLIAATHRNLAEAIKAKRFREDLYYRFAVVRLVVPPLRERTEDIELIVRHFLQRAGRSHMQVSEHDLEELAAYGWPGNVRELRNAVDRALALAGGLQLAIGDALRMGDDLISTPTTPEQSDADALAQGTAPATAAPGAGEVIPYGAAKAAALETFERSYLENLMAGHSSLRSAAVAADMDRKHLRRMLRRYGLWEQAK